MSHDEQLKQAETINIMATQIRDIKKLGPLWGILSFFGTALGVAFTFGIFINRYDLSLVKKPEYAQHVREEDKRLIIDSTKNVAQDSRLDKLETAPLLRLTEVTQRTDKYKRRIYTPVN